MPTYDYVCDTCAQTFEVFQSIKDDALTKCIDPKCPGRIKRKIGAGAGIIFKGSGFYQTDYRSANYSAGAKADKTSSSSSSEAKPSSGGGESKPAAPSTGSSSGGGGSSPSTAT